MTHLAELCDFSDQNPDMNLGTTSSTLPKVIDTHRHLVDEKGEYNPDELNLYLNLPQICKTIGIGYSLKSTQMIGQLASKYSDKISPTVGIHPLAIGRDDYVNDIARLERLITANTVAIGEIGLDSNDLDYDKQLNYFLTQIMIANNNHLPVIVHAGDARDARESSNRKILEIFRNMPYLKPKYGCVFHSFRPELDLLDEMMDNGFYVSFAGKITYPNAKASISLLQKMFKNGYGERVLIETDAPYISSYKNGEMHNPADIMDIVEKMANILCLSPENVVEQCNKNAHEFFKKL